MNTISVTQVLKMVKLWGYIIRRENCKKKTNISIKGKAVITSRGQEGSCARETIYWELLKSVNVPFLGLER